ncbi:MAG: ABC transporter ATP-binding protein [Chthonomonadaceae bacterium]|nr:ABC transporter ATP-binding protein [Chthonomonadaceae bacterium]
MSIFVIQWQLALVSLAILPFMTVFIQRNAKKMRVAQAQVQEDLGNLTAVTQEQLLGTRVIKAFGAEDVSIARFGSLADKTYESQMRAARRVAALKPMVELIGAAALAITVYFCGYLVTHGQLSVAQLGSFIYSLDVINQGAKNLGALRQTMAQVQAAADRIHEEILDVPETVTDSNGARELPVPVGRVEFRDVTFEYPDGTKALDKLNFVIEPGTSLALVGPSGAGKSTIADLLLRFYDPTGGQILFDGIDIRELKTAWYRKQFGVVPQQTFLFAGTVRDNILLGAPYADESSIHEAAKMAHADDFVNSSPLRYDTALGERGVRLSGGEGQRIAIARALVRDPLVLVLDEATSNLDAVSEKAVTEALDEVMHTRTTLFIAHRLTTAARADKILVLRRGEAVESGSHQELLAAGGTYAAMFKAFATGVWDSGHD